MQLKPEEVNVQTYYVPYYKYSERSKDKAGALMRSDTEHKPFEYYLSLVEPGPGDIEVPDKATVEFEIECRGMEFSFHQPVGWYIAQGGDVNGLEKKAWISATEFHHSILESYEKKLKGIFDEI